MSHANHFSPEGRLYQVEYAMEGVARSDLCVGILADDGVMLAIDCRPKTVLIDDFDPWIRFYRLNDDIICTATGIISDAIVILAELRSQMEHHLHKYNEPIPCEDLVTYAAEIKHVYTLQRDKRPFGVSMLFMGWDNRYNFQLYHTDPSGNYSGWRAYAIGKNSNAALSMLRTQLEGKEVFTLHDAKGLAIKVLSNALNIKNITSDMFKIVTLQRICNKIETTMILQSELRQIIQKYYAEERMSRD